jgi:hypothetical protein
VQVRCHHNGQLLLVADPLGDPSDAAAAATLPPPGTTAAFPSTEEGLEEGRGPVGVGLKEGEGEEGGRRRAVKEEEGEGAEGAEGMGGDEGDDRATLTHSLVSKKRKKK